MVCTICECCGGDYYWNWHEAFDKFGFNDGDGQVETNTVADTLRDRGYEVVVEDWGMHNIVITSIKKDGLEHIPENSEDFEFGYDNPRDYLPEDIIHLLDKEFPPT